MVSIVSKAQKATRGGMTDGVPPTKLATQSTIRINKVPCQASKRVCSPQHNRVVDIALRIVIHESLPSSKEDPSPERVAGVIENRIRILGLPGSSILDAASTSLDDGSELVRAIRYFVKYCSFRVVPCPEHVVSTYT